jgi:type IV secretory pathway VirB3-like protein
MNRNNYLPINNPVPTETVSFYERCKQNAYIVGDCIWRSIFVISVTIISLTALYLLICFCILLYVYIFITIDNTIRFIIGKKVYERSFPVCTATKYLGGNCYVTTSTYCTHNNNNGKN